MLLKYVYDKALAQASYMVGCQQTGEALVIDPARDITPYLAAAQEEGLRIVGVAETHIHADFVSGARELAQATGARLYLSAMGGADWQYEFATPDTRLLHDGDSWTMGALLLEALHTPGHTPEHLIFRLTDREAANAPMGLFTGDCLFVGDIGRPDLLETAAGFAGTKEAGARDQFRNIQRLKSMPDYLQIWPGHGAGSACGKALGAVPSSTLGYEKRFNPAFQLADEAAFVIWLLSDQPETPRYFAQMKRVNKQGPALLSTLGEPEMLEGFVLTEVLRQGALVLDARPTEQFAGGHVPGTLNIPPSSQFSTYAGWYVDYDRPTYLITEREDVRSLVRDLRAIGVDNIPGYFPPNQIVGSETLRLLDPNQAAAELAAGAARLLDVRGASEYADEHIPGALHIPYGHLPQHIEQLPRDEPIIVHCASGVRSALAASYLLTQGFAKVASLRGGIDRWRAEGKGVETE